MVPLTDFWKLLLPASGRPDSLKDNHQTEEQYQEPDCLAYISILFNLAWLAVMITLYFQLGGYYKESHQSISIFLFLISTTLTYSLLLKTPAFQLLPLVALFFKTFSFIAFTHGGLHRLIIRMFFDAVLVEFPTILLSTFLMSLLIWYGLRILMGFLILTQTLKGKDRPKIRLALLATQFIVLALSIFFEIKAQYYPIY